MKPGRSFKVLSKTPQTRVGYLGAGTAEEQQKPKEPHVSGSWTPPRRAQAAHVVTTMVSVGQRGWDGCV